MIDSSYLITASVGCTGDRCQRGMEWNCYVDLFFLIQVGFCFPALTHLLTNISLYTLACIFHAFIYLGPVFMIWWVFIFIFLSLLHGSEVG